MKKRFVVIVLFSVFLLSGLSQAYGALTESFDDVISDYFDISNFYKNNGDYKKALEYIKMILMIHPENPEAKKRQVVLLSILYPNLIKVPKTDSQPDKAALENEDLTQLEILGLSITSQPEEQNKPQTAYETRLPIKTAVKNADYYNDLGTYYFMQGDLERSLVTYSDAIKQDKINPVAYYNMGMVYWQKNDIDNAVKFFKKSNMMDTSFAQPLLNLALIYKQQCDDQRQLYYLEKALAADGEDYGIYYLLGNYYYDKDDYKLALKYYQKSTEKRPDFFDGYYGMGATLFSLEDYQKANQALEHAKAINEKSDKLFYALAKTLIILKDYKKAKYYLEEAIMINPNNSYFNELARVNYYLSNYDKSIQLYKTIIAEGSNAETLNELGLCYFKLGNNTAAQEYFQKASEAAPKKTIYLYNLALCSKALGKPKLYQKYLDTALETIPVKPQDYFDLSYIYVDCGLPAKAIKTLNLAIEDNPANEQLKQARTRLLELITKSVE